MAIISPLPLDRTLAPIGTWNPSNTIPYSSSIDPRAANYRPPASGPANIINPYGNPVYQQPQPTQDVLGASPSGPGVPGDSRQRQLEKIGESGALNPSEREELERYRSGGGTPDYSQEISEGYAPALSALDQAIAAAGQGATTQEESIGRNYASGIEKTAAESAQLTGDTTEQQTAFNKIIRSAYEEAVRAFNALNQQRVSRFGGGSSAGQAVGELAQQEFFRQQGNVTEQQTTGNLQFAKEFANIGRYIGQKKTDLENWKLDAVGQIKQNLTDTLVAIAQNRGQIESNKTRDKLAALQTARENVQRVSDADTAFRQNLALTSIGQAQEIAGRAFTPAEINAQLAAWGIPLRGISRGGGQGTTAPTGLPGGQQQDEFGNLINA